MKKLLAGVFVSAAAVVFSTAPGAYAQTYNLTLCGASPGGLWSLLGAGVDAAVKASFPGSTVTYQTSGGGLANVALLDKGTCDLAIIHDAEAKLALGGKPPFKVPVESLATVAQLYTWAPMQAIVNADYAAEHGIESLEDIAAKKLPIRIALNKRGNIASDVGEAMLNAVGASVDDIKSWGGDVQFAASGEQGDLMRDRRVDLLLNSLFVNHSSIRELASAINVNLLPMSEASVKAVVDEWDINEYTIKNEAYDWTDKDILTVTLSAQLFARTDADETMVRDVTKALVDNINLMSGVHKAMAPLDVALMAGAKTVPYHPAAKAVFSEAGF